MNFVVNEAIELFKLSMATHLLDEAPKIVFNEHEVTISFVGYDFEGEFKHETILCFENVLGLKIAKCGVAENFYKKANLDSVSEILNSDWLEFCRNNNEKLFEIYALKHYIIQTEGDYGYMCYEFIATGFSVKKSEVIE